MQFGSRVTYRTEDGETRTVILTGEDEADPAAGRIAYAAPVARALTGAVAGSSVTVKLRGRPVELEVLAVESRPTPTDRRPARRDQGQHPPRPVIRWHTGCAWLCMCCAWRDPVNP